MKNIFSLLSAFFVVISISAQDQIRSIYATQLVQQRIFEKNPEYSNAVGVINKYAQSYKPSRGKTFKKKEIPIVFHVLYHPSQKFPSNEMVEAQLAELNNAFDTERAKNEFKHKADTLEGFSKRVAKMELAFCAPKEGPNGDKKAHYIQFAKVDTLNWNIFDNMKSKATGGVDPWDTDRYLNVWVVSMKPGIRGYAQMPGAGPKETDGVVIDFNFFGSGQLALPNYNQGKTLVHLVASYLGLYELWNETEMCKDDFIGDTPIHNSPNFDCPDYDHISICSGYETEMTMNYMDSSPDDCIRMFTAGQKYRLHTMLSPDGPRAGLLDTKTKCDRSNTVNETSPLAITEVNQYEENRDIIRIFPNPAKNSFMVSWQLEQPGLVDIVVTNIHNQRIDLRQNLDPVDNQFEFFSNDWPSGIYIVTLMQEQRIVSTRRIIINQ